MTAGDQALNFVYLLGVLILVGSSLMVRRLPLGQSMKMAAAWLIIFAAAFAVFALKEDFIALGSRLVQAGSDEPLVDHESAEVRIPKGENGHFWAVGAVNGVRVRFLVDSGATVTTISSEIAREAHIEPESAMPVPVQTANGLVAVQRAEAQRLTVGSIQREGMIVYIDPNDNIDVLGMNFLSSLTSWRVEGPWLILNP